MPLLSIDDAIIQARISVAWIRGAGFSGPILFGLCDALVLVAERGSCVLTSDLGRWQLAFGELRQYQLSRAQPDSQSERTVDA